MGARLKSFEFKIFSNLLFLITNLKAFIFSQRYNLLIQKRNIVL